jgi:WD40 repeat protein
MELISSICSYPECSEIPEYWKTSEKPLKFFCFHHIPDSSDNTDPAMAISKPEDKNSYFNQLKSLKENLKKLKKNTIESYQKLIKVINTHLQKSLEKIEKDFKAIEINLNYILKQNKIFEPVIHDIEKKLKKQLDESTFFIEPIIPIIESFFTKNLNLEAKADVSALIDSRLINNKTPLEKKLSILSKSLGFSKSLDPELYISPSSISKMDLNFFKNPSKLIVSPENQLIFTINNKEENLIIWKIAEKITLNDLISFNRSKIKDFYLINKSKTLLILFEDQSQSGVVDAIPQFYFGKIKIQNPLADRTRSEETGTVTIFKLFELDQFIATATFDGKLKIWRVKDLKLQREFQMHTAYYHGSISSFDISSDGKFVVSGCVNGEMCLRSIFNDSQIHKTSAHSGGVTAVAFSPEGEIIVSGGEDKTFKIWKRNEFRVPFLKKDAKYMKIKEISFGVTPQLILTGCPKSVIIWKYGQSLEKTEIKSKSALLNLTQIFPDASNFMRFI